MMRDRVALKAYTELHPACEVWGCPIPPMPEPHHIRPRSRGGRDLEQNLIRLCFDHHVGREGWHPLGGRRWFLKFSDRLSEDARVKIERFLEFSKRSA